MAKIPGIGDIIEIDLGLYMLVDTARNGYLAAPVDEFDYAPTGIAEFLSEKQVMESEVVGPA